MNRINSAVETFDSSVRGWMSKVEQNEYISTALALFLILYAGVAAPKLPAWFARLFDYTVVKLLVFFLIAYIARGNPTVAIIAAIGLMVTLITLNKLSTNQKIAHLFRRQEAMAADLSASKPAPSPAPVAHPEEHTLSEHSIAMEEASIMGPDMQMPSEVLGELHGEMKSNVRGEMHGESREASGAPVAPINAPEFPFVNSGCTRRANYRDSFYPQYVNMKPDAYLARYTGNEVGGYDMSARYAGSGGGRRNYNGDRASYNGVRGSYN